MADVVQVIATDRNHPDFEEGIVNGDWHATLCVDAVRTVCGIQLEGDDGYGPSDSKQGKVTCPLCRSILGQVQNIKRWR